MGLVTQRRSTVPMAECKVTDDKTRRAHAVEYIIGYSYPLCHTVQGTPTLGPPIGPWGLIVNHPTLSYKRLGWAPFSRSQKKERLRHGRLEHNTTQFSRGCGVLHSGGPNHVNHHVHHVHLELTTKRLKVFPTKEPQRVAPVATLVKVS
jgi:hypothetical protein